MIAFADIRTEHPTPRVREIRVKIPFRLYVLLASTKLIHGRRIGDLVTEALETYFAEQVR